MTDTPRQMRTPAARLVSWSLVSFAWILSGCANAPPSSLSQVPAGAVAYPGISHFVGPIAFHRLYSILPGEATFVCPTKAKAASNSPTRTIEVVSCTPGSEAALRKIGDALFRSFSFLQVASDNGMRFCDVYVGLVGYDTGVHARDTQSLKRACARLMMLSRWEPGSLPDQEMTDIRSIIRNSAHEAYHITLRREGPRTRDRVVEEAEAGVVGHCAEWKILGPTSPSLANAGIERPDERNVGRIYHETLAGDRAAEAAIRNGKVAAIAARAPVGTARTLLTACAAILSPPLR